MSPLAVVCGVCTVLALGLSNAGGDVLLQADFDSDADGFVFSADVFRGTSQPGYGTSPRMSSRPTRMRISASASTPPR